MKFLIYMAIILSPILAQAKDCSWDDPGKNPYQGNAAHAINSYDMPWGVKKALIVKVNENDFDDDVKIDSKRISGKHQYKHLRNMFFGNGQKCDTVTRHWTRGRIEQAKIYTVGAYSIIIPAICKNVSQVDLESFTAPVSAAGATGALVATTPLPVESAGAGAEPAALLTPLEGRKEILSLAPNVEPEDSLAGTSSVVAVQSIAGANIGYGGGLAVQQIGVITSAVPEPPTRWLALTGIAAVAFWKWVKR